MRRIAVGVASLFLAFGMAQAQTQKMQTEVQAQAPAPDVKQGPDVKIISASVRGLVQRMKDPDSFRLIMVLGATETERQRCTRSGEFPCRAKHVVKLPDLPIVCVQYRGKNSYGAYETELAVMGPDGQMRYDLSEFPTLANHHCQKASVDITEAVAKQLGLKKSASTLAQEWQP
jgi:hypothetical protein